MRNRSGKKDLNERAYSIVQELTGQSKKKKPEREKNPAAVALGRLGGLKGGKARAKKLSARALRLSAKRAAEARWKSRKG